MSGFLSEGQIVINSLRPSGVVNSCDISLPSSFCTEIYSGSFKCKPAILAGFLVSVAENNSF
jgi:hypothetical protein